VPPDNARISIDQRDVVRRQSLMSSCAARGLAASPCWRLPIAFFGVLHFVRHPSNHRD
jgi:hypothetical protein